MNILNNHLNANKVNSAQAEINKDNTQVEKKVETKKDGKKLLLAGVVAAAAIGTAVVLMSKGKAKPSDVQKAGKKVMQEVADNLPKHAGNVVEDVTKKSEKITTAVVEQVDEVIEKVLPKINDVKFDKGIAFKDGEKYSGIIEDTLKSGKKVVLEYQDGVIQKSTIDGVEKVIDHKAVKELSQEAKAQHDKLSKILSDKDNLSLEDFTKQIDEIKFKSKSDLLKIDDIKSSKLKVKAKAEAEKIKKLKLTNEEPVICDLDKLEYENSYIFGKDAFYDVSQYPDSDAVLEIKEFLQASKDIPLNKASILEDYTKKPYDMPLKFMISANESAKKGTHIIVDEVPEMFKGIDTKILSEKIDKLGIFIQSNKFVSFKVGEKSFKAKFLDAGQIGKVCKIFDDDGHSVIVKYFKDPSLIGLQGSYAEIPILRQANLDGVVDVPKFYMSNPVSKWVESSVLDGSSSLGGWQMVEFIDEATPLKSGNLKFFDWLKMHGLYFGDYNSGTKIGDYVVDVGGVCAKEYDPFFIMKGGPFSEKLLRSYHKGKSAQDIIDLVQ